MNYIVKMFAMVLFMMTFLFSRDISKVDQRFAFDRKINNKFSLVNNYSKDGVNEKLERKRVHKRRRKIRKPVKGLR